MQISGTDPHLEAALRTHDRVERWDGRSRRLMQFLVPSGGLAWLTMLWPRLLSPAWHFVIAAAWPALLGSWTVSRFLYWRETARLASLVRGKAS